MNSDLDLGWLVNKTYPGRGIAVGMTFADVPFAVYLLTGRSGSSQARRLVFNDDTQSIQTSVTNPKLLEEGIPALLIYDAIAPLNGQVVVSNGAQTDLLYSAVAKTEGKHSPDYILSHHLSVPHFVFDSKSGKRIDLTGPEPDKPNYTSRISACLDLDAKQAGFYVISADNNLARKAWQHNFALVQNEASAITTYLGGNEAPRLKPFQSASNFTVHADNALELARNIFDATVHPCLPQTDDISIAAAVMMFKPKNRIEWAIVNRHGGELVNEMAMPVYKR